jgi:subfamily B ATP-binding cassette protein MsbA
MIVFAATTAAYAWLIGPVLRFIFVPGDGAPPGRLPDAVWSWLVAHRDVYPLLLAGLVLALALVRGLAQFGRGWCMGVVGQRVQLAIRDAVFDKLLRLNPYQLVRMDKGDLSSRFVSDVVILEYAITHGLSSVIGDSVQVVALVGLALWLDPVMGAISLVILPFSSLLIVWLGRRIRQSHVDAMTSLGEISGSLVSAARGLASIQAYNAQDAMRERFRRRNLRYYGRVMRSVLLGSLSSPLMELIAAGALAATLWYARVRIGSETLEPEQFVSFFAAVFLMYRPIKSLGGLNALMNRGLAAARRIFGLLDTEVEPVVQGDDEAPALSVAIELRDVTFAFEQETVLDGVDLTIPAGRTTALVGASGAGKTTLAALLTRLLHPDSGRILWDGTPVERFSAASLRRQVALVPQDPFLMHDTVRANVALGDEDATDEEVHRALALGDARRFVEFLPAGLDEVVGEEGSSLSGGERQRICLARAALRDAPVLVLDEAASSLDAASEEAIRTALERVASGRTVLVIGHRLSSVRDADSIAVLSEGRIVEQGRYDELARPGTAFHELFRSQL